MLQYKLTRFAYVGVVVFTRIWWAIGRPIAHYSTARSINGSDPESAFSKCPILGQMSITEVGWVQLGSANFSRLPSVFSHKNRSFSFCSVYFHQLVDTIESKILYSPTALQPFILWWTMTGAAHEQISTSRSRHASHTINFIIILMRWTNLESEIRSVALKTCVGAQLDSHGWLA